MLIKYVILYRSGKLYNKIYTLMKFLITFKKKSKDKMHEIKLYNFRNITQLEILVPRTIKNILLYNLRLKAHYHVTI